jgi:hypothetical protein
VLAVTVTLLRVQFSCLDAQSPAALDSKGHCAFALFGRGSEAVKVGKPSATRIARQFNVSDIIQSVLFGTARSICSFEFRR